MSGNQNTKKVGVMNPKKNPSANTFVNRVAQFERDQSRNNVDVPSVSSTTIPPVSQNNPYLRARLEILSKMNPWRRNEVQRMEQTGDTNNRFYTDFVHDVSILGDSFS